MWGQELYVLKCQGGMRVRDGWCRRDCPNRWPEFDGKWCMKLGTIRLPDYSVWVVEDGRVTKVSGVRGLGKRD